MGILKVIGRDNAGNDGRVCRHAHCAGKDPQTGSVVLKSHLPLLYKDPEKTPNGGPFSALWTIHKLSPIDFSRLSSTTMTTTTPHFNVRRKQGQDTKRSQSWNAKGRWVGRGGGRDVVDYSALCVFCEDEIFKHTRKRDRI